jgi:hypothetical protein
MNEIINSIRVNLESSLLSTKQTWTKVEIIDLFKAATIEALSDEVESLTLAPQRRKPGTWMR